MKGAEEIRLQVEQELGADWSTCRQSLPSWISGEFAGQLDAESSLRLTRDVCGSHLPALVDAVKSWNLAGDFGAIEISASLRERGSMRERQQLIARDDPRDSFEYLMKALADETEDLDALTQLSVTASAEALYVKVLVSVRRGVVRATIAARPGSENHDAVVEAMLVSEVLPDRLFDLAVRTVECFNETVGGFVHPGDEVYAVEPDIRRLGPRLVRGYSWMVVLPAAALDRVGGSARLSQIGDRVHTARTADGEEALIARLAPSVLEAVSATRLQDWRSALEPVLAPSRDLSGHDRRDYGTWANVRPLLLLEDDWFGRGMGLCPWP